MAPVAPPIFSDTVNQQFFIEAQGGSQDPVTYLDRFPDTVYNKSLDSLLVKFLYVLLGPVGAGLLRQEYLEARLAFEDAGLDTTDLDDFYNHPFAFARAAAETYTVDASASLLSIFDRARILADDASFRNRCMDYLRGVRAGGTPLGINLVAKSGLNRPVTVVENYKALYDSYSDTPLGLPFYGTTRDLGEVIIAPRQDVPESSVQILNMTGFPAAGWFTLVFPTGPSYKFVQIQTLNGSNVVTFPDGFIPNPGAYVAITNDSSVRDETTSPTLPAPVTYAQAGSSLTTSVPLLYPVTSGSAGQALNLSHTGSYWAYVGNAQTNPLPYNATAAQVQSALAGSALVGLNVSVTGGPLPSNPIAITFTNALADQSLPPLEVVTFDDISPPLSNTVVSPSGVGGPTATSPLVPELTDVLSNPLTVSVNVAVTIVGNSADAAITAINPRDAHAMQVGLDRIRPQTSFITTKAGSSAVRRQAINQLFHDTSYAEVVKYETGDAHITWPTLDQTHWIEANREHEAPKPVNTYRQQYWSFHNISSIISYTDNALLDPHYTNPGGPFPSPTLYPRATQYPVSSLEPGGSTFPADALLPDEDIQDFQPIWVTYWDNHIGPFNQAQATLYPFLGSQSVHTQFLPTYALAPNPDPLIITTSLKGVGIVNDEYPVDYLGLPGVAQLSTQQAFWASLERSNGTDYLEIDLGSVQAVNYIYFEASQKPYTIFAAYDILDMAPQRRFNPVTIAPSTQGASITNLNYSGTTKNPWESVTMSFTNTLGQMIYTRFIRIGFARNADTTTTPFINSAGGVIPYSIEVRNLRVGRNVNSSPPPNTV